jgi:hypothetical protein
VTASAAARRLAGLDDHGNEIEEPKIQCNCPCLMFQT